MCVSSASAGIYHVAVNEAQSSDTNDGYSPSYFGARKGPWQTLTRAAAAAQAGDTVIVHPGDYTAEGPISLKASGLEGSPVRFVAASPDAVIAGFVLVNLRWIEIEGFTMIDREFRLPAGWREMPRVVVEYPALAINLEAPWSTRVRDLRRKYRAYMSIFEQFGARWTNGIDVRGSEEILLKRNNISHVTAAINLSGKSKRVKVIENTMHHCRYAVFTWRPRPSVVDAVIQGNYAFQIFGDSFDIREGATRVVVERNTSEYVAISHISLHTGATQCKIRGNTLRFGGFYTPTMEHPGSSAVSVHGSGVGNVVEGNLASYHIDETGRDGNGFIADMMGTVGVAFRNNIAYRNMGSGITTTGTSNCTITHNSLIENGHQTRSLHNGSGVRISDTSRGLIITNNLFYKNAVAGIFGNNVVHKQHSIDANTYLRDTRPLIWNSVRTSVQSYMTLDEVRQNMPWESNGQEFALLPKAGVPNPRSRQAR